MATTIKLFHVKHYNYIIYNIKNNKRMYNVYKVVYNINYKINLTLYS